MRAGADKRAAGNRQMDVHLGIGVSGQARIQHGIGDLVGDLVRVALVDRLGGEQEDALLGGRLDALGRHG